MYRVVVIAVLCEVLEHAPAKAQRLPNSSVAIRAIEWLGPRNGEHPDPSQHRRIRLRPLAACKVGYVVAVCRERLRKAAKPSLGAAYRPRIETIIDDADPHANP